MTVPREPVSIENALMAVIGALTMEVAAARTSRKPGYLIALSHPARREQLTVRDLEILDLAHRERFGGGFPLFEALGRRLESNAAEQFADQAAIGRATIDVAREGGQATAALVAAAQPGAGPRALETALRELEEADASYGAAIAIVRDALRRARDGPPPAPT